MGHFLIFQIKSSIHDTHMGTFLVLNIFIISFRNFFIITLKFGYYITTILITNFNLPLKLWSLFIVHLRTLYKLSYLDLNQHPSLKLPLTWLRSSVTILFLFLLKTHFNEWSVIFLPTNSPLY